VTSEESAMFLQCKTEYLTMVQRIESVIKDKWPETLTSNGAIWQWLEDSQPKTRAKQRQLAAQMETAWQNGIFNEFKKLTLEWGRLQLEIFKSYAQHLKETEA
jgi:hypothetical protein